VVVQTAGSSAGRPPAPNPVQASTPAPSPSALFGSPLAFPDGSPLLNFFLDTYRTPPFLLPIYIAAAQRYGVPWQVLAAINEVETDYGLDLGPSSAGAEGWMQFLPEEWLIYGVDANGAGVRDPNNPADAIFATARYLAAAGASHDLRGAIYAYNHSAGYVESVILRTRLLAATPQSLISSLSAIASGRFPVAGGRSHAVTAAWSKPPQASVAASPGAPVLAVQTAEVLQIGRNATLGRFIELRDAYGNTYTYAHLGRVLKRRGTWLAAGTVLGSVGAGPAGSRAHFLFAIRPAGAGPIDPLPLLQSWQLLDETQGHTQQGAQPLFGPDSREALINETQLLRKRQLRSRVRRDPTLDAAQWRKLLTRVSRIAEPHVPSAPTSSAVVDNPGSPLPKAEPLPGAPAVTPLTSGPEVALETPGTGAVLTEKTEDPELVAKTGGLSSIASYEFQYRPAESPESEAWTTIETTTSSSTIFETNIEDKPVSDGLYNLRVIVTTTEGSKYESELTDRLIANSSPVVTLTTHPTADVRGTITLAAAIPSTANVSSVSFQWAHSNSPPGSVRWTTIGASLPATGLVSASFDTKTLPDEGNGEYDFRVVPVNPGEFVSIPVRKLLVDNAPPAVELTGPTPGSHLGKQVTLSAEATDAGSGVASVRFQARSLAGAGAWIDVGGKTTIPESLGSSIYTHTLDTESLQNGPYDFRAIAEDVAGNEATSQVVSDVEVDNPSLTPAVSASIAGVAAPARDVSFLGAIAGSPEHEAWAYGFTSAPPAEVNGSQLPYEAQGEQLVLLRYTDKDSWQIAEVPRGPEGEPFKLLKADEVSDATGGAHVANQVHVAGAMTPSGEAWLSVAEASTNRGQPPVVGLFHRAPGENQFRLDAEATRTLGPLLGSEAEDPGRQGVTLRLGEGEGGHAYGMLTASGQYAALGELRYGLLQDGKWTVETVKAATEPPKPFSSADPVRMKLEDVQGPDEGWGAFEVEGHPPGLGLVLGHLQGGEWTFSPTGLDALDLTGALATESNGKGEVLPEALKADGKGVWIEARVDLTPGRESGRVVARYEAEGASGHITNSWCTLPGTNSCEEPLESPSGRATVPDAIFQTESGPVALGLREGSVDVFAHGEWTSVLAPGYGPFPGQTGADDVFASPNEGWLGGVEALGHWTANGAPGSLTSWPLPDRAPLMSVALPPGSPGEAGESGALAVGFDGTTLSYDASAGWLVQPTPPRARKLNLLGVAFAGPSSAFAVGEFGVILHWDGTTWSEDPQSTSLTDSQLNAVAFAQSGEGWAVGADGTILHYNGSSWSKEQPPEADSGVGITSVAVAGSEVFAVAAGNLITRSPDGDWTEVDASVLPSGLARGNLRVVAGLPDGGIVAAGKSLVLVREAAGQGFAYAAQPLEGIAVALAPFRDAGGRLRTYVSIAPPAAGRGTPPEVGGFPPGDGELLRQTEGGWQDLSHAQYAGNEITGDGALKSDPVLAVATGPAGEHAWAAGGYDGTEDAAGQGTEEPLSSRPVGWQSASIWRYDTTGSAQPPDLQSTTPSLPAEPGTVSFAFFTSPMCKEECVSAPDAQPDVNLTSAAKQIAAYAAQPGGPAFAMLGGNAVGPLEGSKIPAAKQEADFAHLPELLAPLAGVPTFAALGPFDPVPGATNPALPWAEAFAGAPPPFGSGPDAPGITPVSSPGETPATGEAHLYYAFDAAQNGGTLRVLVLDNADPKGALEESTRQRPWLEQQLQMAEGENVPVVVVTAHPLRNLNRGDETEAEEIAALLAHAGVREGHKTTVLAVLTTDGAQPGNSAGEVHELNEHHLIPEDAGPEEPKIPEYEGATLGYQQTKNNGVMWYFASIDTNPGTRSVQVAAVPVIESLSLKAIDGLSVARSRTLEFEAVGRRPPGTLATKVGENFQGYDDYVEIPAPNCGATCVSPSYSFTSSEPTVGNFVEPTGEGSPFPKLSASGHPIASSTSGLFCAYNAGTTTVTVTAGLFSYSETVTVQRGSFGRPCGTVPPAGLQAGTALHSSQTQRPVKATAAPPPPPAAALSAVNPTLHFIPPPPATQAPPVTPAPAPKLAAPAPRPSAQPPESLGTPMEQLGIPPAILPAATPPVEPIPPGAGGYAQSPSAAERREKARKQASQSAFAIRPAGASSQESRSGEYWFYAAVGIATLLALLLSARALPAGPRPRPVLLIDRRAEAARRRRRR
jgi:murein DD-endopeptidase MepM/ murein hydrolase activator NlpD